MHTMMASGVRMSVCQSIDSKSLYRCYTHTQAVSQADGVG